MEKTIVIADDNVAYLEETQRYFQNVAGYRVVGVAKDGMEAISLVEKNNPDFLLLDIVMPELDGFAVLSAIACSDFRPTVIMISQLSGEGFVSKSLAKGASYYMMKPIKYDKLKEVMDDFSQDSLPYAAKVSTRPVPMGRQAIRDPARRSVDEKISNIFISVGIPAHIKGYQFLREVIKLTIEDPNIINSITKRLYPAIAEKFDTSASKVERAIRHAIEVAWSRGKIDNINMIFGLKIYNPNEKPTNGEFVALIADKICLEGIA